MFMPDNKPADRQPQHLRILLALLIITVGLVAFLFLYDFKKLGPKIPPRKPLGEEYSQYVLALDLDGNGIDVSNLGMGPGASRVYFDLDNDQFAERTAWVIGKDGLLGIDLNHNGKIDGQRELFGNSRTYADGFQKLVLLDNNQDGVINQEDPSFHQLLVWVDTVQDGVSTSEELHTLGSLGISEIHFKDPQKADELKNDNYIDTTSTFVREGSKFQIVSVWLKNSSIETRALTQKQIDIRTLFLPTLKGFGELKDLHIAMSEDEELLNMVRNFNVSWNLNKFEDPKSLNAQIENILFRWAKVDIVNEGSRGLFVSAKELKFMERLTGRIYGASTRIRPPQPYNGAQGKVVHDSYIMAFGAMKAQLLSQVGLGSFFAPPLKYNILTGEVNQGDLTQDGVNRFEATAESLPAASREIYWAAVADFLLYVKPKARFTSQEIEMLDLAIAKTASGNTWEKIAGLAVQSHLNKLTLQGSPGDDYQVTSEGDDEIYGNGGNDTLIGMTGNDVLSGGVGSDTYKFKAGDGNDVITEEDGVEDTISFEGSGIDRDMVKLERQSDDLIVHYTDRDTIKISGYYTAAVKQVERIEFPDHSKVELTSLMVGQ